MELKVVQVELEVQAVVEQVVPVQVVQTEQQILVEELVVAVGKLPLVDQAVQESWS